MGHKYFNSVITSHRGRLGSVRAFLRSLFLSSRSIDINSFEIIIADLDKNDEVDKAIGSYKDKLNITHCKIKYDGLFWKSKALNHCASLTQGKYITMLDIDAIVTPLFLQEVEKYYKDPINEKSKMAYRVRFLDEKNSRVVSRGDFSEGVINNFIVKHKKFRQAFERYTKDEVKIRNMEGHQVKWMTDQALGNSHYTMRKEDFMAIGGYDEKFIGWACEDLDFNRRAFDYLESGYLNPTPFMTVFSMHHNRTGWMNRNTTKKNEKLYANNKANNIISIPISDSWGKF